jgi:hypothetical protein
MYDRLRGTSAAETKMDRLSTHEEEPGEMRGD